jgi:hypothetical protein
LSVAAARCVSGICDLCDGAHAAVGLDARFQRIKRLR